MTTDVEELLREGIDRLTAGAGVPDGLAGRARQRNRRRRIALGTTGTAGTAIVAVAAVLMATAGTGPLRHGPGVTPAQAQTTAYVVARTGQTLAAAERGDAVEQVRTVGRNWSAQYATINGPGQISSIVSNDASQMITWNYRGQSRWEGFTADGRRLFDGNEIAIRSASGGQRWVGYQVSYQAKTWSYGVARAGYVPGGATPAPCSTFEPDPFASGSGEAGQIRTALACGQFKTDGRQRVDGVDAMKLVSVRPLPSKLGGFRFTLWVNPATYLPVRTSWNWAVRPGQQGLIQSDFRWLPPNPVNRAALTVPVPSGFREVPRSAWSLEGPNAFAPVFAITAY